MKKTVTVFFIALSFFITSITPIISFAWGDSNGGRPSYSLQDMSEGALDDIIIFNSIAIEESDYDWYKSSYNKDMPVGVITHEKNYVGARKDTGVNAGAYNTWQGNDIQVEDGGLYIVRLYVHNDNPNGFDAVAKNTKVYFNVPTKTAYQIKINGYIHADNADPTDYVDYINFNSDNCAFHLEYVYGSALIENNGKAGSSTLSDNIVEPSTGGVLIGYDALDGNVPGGYQYDNYITIRVKAVFDYNFTTEKKLNANRNEKLGEIIEGNIGDMIEIQALYRNDDDYMQPNVIIQESLPKGLQYVPGSTRLFNDSYPNGIDINHDDIVTDLGLNIGSYDGGSSASVCFIAKIVDDDLAEGVNILTSYGQVHIGTKNKQNFAKIAVYKNTKFQTTKKILSTLIFLCVIAVVILGWRVYQRKKIH